MKDKAKILPRNNMTSFGWRLVVFSLMAYPTYAHNCSIPPVYVDIHKREVQGTDVYQYGSFIGAGSPAQNQSLWPSIRRNETSVARVDFCEQSILFDCLNSTRGNFNTADSTTWTDDREYDSLDEQRNDFEGPFGKDNVHLYTHYIQTNPASEIVLPDTSLQTVSNGTLRPGIVGLGLSSTILRGLSDSNKIAGRTYSLYVGSGMDRAGGKINGSLTLGGYDTGRFNGSVYDFPINTGDAEPLAVQISDIVINDASDPSNAISLLKNDGSQDSEKFKPFEAIITTDQYPMSFPYEITQAYKSLLSAERSEYADGSLRLQKQFRGSMSIKLSGGFTVTIPSDVMSNETQISPVAERDLNSTQPFYLSLAWLSQVYLMVDIEASRFYLAQAIVENKFITLETFCPGETPQLYELKKGDDFASTGMVGAVIGGVLGGLGFIVLMAFLIIFGIRRKNNKKMQQLEQADGRAPSFTNSDTDTTSLESQGVTSLVFADVKR